MSLPEKAPTKRASILNTAWLWLLIGASGAWCLAAGRALSATFDEPTYIDCGMLHWFNGSYKPFMRLGTMPLAVDLQTLPLYILERWYKFVYMEHDLGWALPVCRAGTLIFWALLLVYVFRIARSLGGDWAGRIAVALVAFEPCMLGHAALATTDIAVTGMLAAFAFEFHAGRTQGWWRRVGVPAIWYGLAILAKASALVFAPLFMIVIEFDRLWRLKEYVAIPAADLKARGLFLWKGMWALRRDFFVIIFAGLAVTFLYVRSDWTTEPTFMPWAQTLPPGKWHDIMVWLAGHLHIFTNAGEGLVQQVKHNMRKVPTYIFGEEHKRAVWYYFPVALLIKASIPFLLMPLVIVMTRARALVNWPCLCALALLAYSVTCHVQIGVRFMFPLMALAMAGYGVAVAEAWRAGGGWKKWLPAGFVAAGVCYTVVSALLVWPEGICYTNEFWGGTRNAYALLSDSNYDWGQGLKELLQWRAEHHVEVMDVWYFGLDYRADMPPLRQMPVNDPGYRAGRSWDEVFRGKCVAVSTTQLYGAYRTPTGLEAVAYLKQHQPVGRTMTYFIYDFR